MKQVNDLTLSSKSWATAFDVMSFPPNWTNIAIGSCCDILDNMRVPVNSEEREARRGDVPYYGANGQVGWIDDYIFNEDLVLIAEDGGDFDSYETKPIAYMIRGKSWVNNHAHVIRARQGTTNAWIFYNLVHKDIRSYIGGTTRTKLNQAGLRAIEIALPPLLEQICITEILSTIDTAIRQTEILIAKLTRIKYGLMQDLLTRGIDEHGNIRSEKTHEFQDSPLGRIPEEWKISDLVSVTNKIGDGVHQSVKTTESGIPFLFVSCVRDGKILWESSERIPETVYREISRGKEPRPGMILYTVVGSYGHAALVHDHAQFAFQRHIAFMFPDRTKVLPAFLAEWLNSAVCRRHADKVALGNAQKTITLGCLKELPLAVPSVKEQERIAKVLAQNNCQIQVEESYRAKLLRIKSGLMENLLAGEVCVNHLLKQ